MDNKSANFIAASNLAAGVISNLPDDLGADYDARMVAQVALTWEVFRSFGHAMVKAHDSKEWPTPKSVVDDLQGRLPGLISQFAGNPAVAAILQGLLKNLGGGSVTPPELT